MLITTYTYLYITLYYSYLCNNLTPEDGQGMPETCRVTKINKKNYVKCHQVGYICILHAPIATLPYIQETALIDYTPLIMTGDPA
jgi:hypothetical protein